MSRSAPTAGPTRLAAQAGLMAATLMVALPTDAATFKTLYTAPAGQPTAGVMRDGVLYGIDPVGGDAGVGAIFSLAKGSYTTLYSFSGGADGSTPNTRLVTDESGALYGTTQSGGSGVGTVFKFSAGRLRVLHTFSGSGDDGGGPLDGLTRDRQGNFYGTSAGGAIGTNGSAYLVSPRGQFTVLHDFMSGSDGHCPFTGVALARHGVIGTVVGRGFGGQPTGAVYRMSTSGTVRTIYSFTDQNDGEWPDDAPTVDRQGNIYGVTHVQGGSAFAGAVYKIAAGGKFSVLHDFSGGRDGYGPDVRLAVDDSGTLYGTTEYGGDAPGTAGHGTVFSISGTGHLITLHRFTGQADGANPAGGVILGSDGKLRGGTLARTIFQITP